MNLNLCRSRVGAAFLGLTLAGSALGLTAWHGSTRSVGMTSSRNQESQAAAVQSGSPAKRTATRVAVKKTRSSAYLGSLENVPETYANCGPASISSVLAYWHVYRSQAQVASIVRGDHSDWGMAPFDVPAYARSLGLDAITGPRANQQIVRALISNGIPVIANQWLKSGDEILHYRVIDGYNNRNQSFVAMDPQLGSGYTVSYAEFQSVWQVRDRRFIIIFPPAKRRVVEAILHRHNWRYSSEYRQDLAWFLPQLKSSAIDESGTWLNYNGYVEAAWAADQAGEFRVAGRYLKKARTIGESPVLIGWIRKDMKRREAA